MVLYVFAAIAFVLVVGWAIYVLPTPGPLGPADLAIAMLPAFVLLFAVLGGVGALWGVAYLVRAAFRGLNRR